MVEAAAIKPMYLVTAEMAANNVTGLKPTTVSLEPILCLFLEALWLLFTDKPSARKQPSNQFFTVVFANSIT